MRGTGRVVALALAGALVAGCGGGEEEAPAGPDTFTLTTNGSTAPYTDEMQDVSIGGWLLVGGGHRVQLIAPGVNVMIDVPGQSPGALTANVTYILGGLTYANASAPVTFTRLEPAFLGILEGSFSNVTLTRSGMPDLVVSGSFRATRLN